MDRIIYWSGYSGRSTETVNLLNKTFPKGTVDFTRTEKSVIRQIISGEADVAVLDVDFYDKKVSNIISVIRNFGYKCPFLVLAKIENKEPLDQIKSFGGSFLLEKPYSEKELASISKKLLNAGAIPQRMHKRFDCNEFGFLEKYGCSETESCRVLNLSKGGAFIEMNKSERFESGDVLKFNMSLAKMKKSRQLNAKVVWVKQEQSSAIQCLGLSFITYQEVFANLVDAS